MKNVTRQLIRFLAQTTRLNQYEYPAPLRFEIPPHYRNFIFRELNEKDFQTNAVFQEKNRACRYTNHLKKGHRCYGFESSTGSIAAYLWLTIGKSDKPIPNPAFKGFDWLITKNEAYIWDCRSVPDYQGQGLYREGLKRLVHLCQQKKIYKIMINCEPKNKASNAGIQSAGFVLKGTVFAMKTKLFKLIHCSHRILKISTPSSSVTTREVFPWT